MLMMVLMRRFIQEPHAGGSLLHHFWVILLRLWDKKDWEGKELDSKEYWGRRKSL